MNIVRAALGFLAVSCIIALVVLSWLPKDMEIRTGLAGQIEHMIAYCGTALLVRLAWPARRGSVAAVWLIALAAVLEIGQIWVPGRSSQFVDFAAGAFGTVAGLALAAAMMRTAVGRRIAPL